MSGWRLTLKHEVNHRVDASAIDLDKFQRSSIEEVRKTRLMVEGTDVPLADFFAVERFKSDGAHLSLEGDLRHFDNVATNHASGVLTVDGCVGDYCASHMSGGTAVVLGDAGDFLGAPKGARRVGMRGGRVLVTGSAGNYVAHRMRRGEIFVESDVADFAASQVVAGTLFIGGSTGEQPCFGMRRGTLVANTAPAVPLSRFSAPTKLQSVFLTLIARSIDSIKSRAPQAATTRLSELAQSLIGGKAQTRRGDKATQGQAEIITP